MRAARNRRWVAAAAAALGLAIASSAASAQPPGRAGRNPYDGYARVDVVVAPDGLYLGAGLVATRVVGQSGGPELIDSGSGMSLFGGLRMSHRLALEIGWVVTFHDPDTMDFNFGSGTDHLVLNGFTGDAKIYLGRPGDRVEPFVQAGLGLYLLDKTYVGARSNGTGIQGGGGLELHIAQYVDVGLRGLYRGITMSPPRSGADDTFISALGAEANLVLRF
jgi:hypothetical protein